MDNSNLKCPSAAACMPETHFSTKNPPWNFLSGTAGKKKKTFNNQLSVILDVWAAKITSQFWLDKADAQTGEKGSDIEGKQSSARHSATGPVGAIGAKQQRDRDCTFTKCPLQQIVFGLQFGDEITALQKLTEFLWRIESNYMAVLTASQIASS